MLKSSTFNSGIFEFGKVSFKSFNLFWFNQEFIFIGEPIQVYDLTDAYDVLYNVMHENDWSYFINQYDIELQPELELIVDNDNNK